MHKQLRIAELCLGTLYKRFISCAPCYLVPLPTCHTSNHRAPRHLIMTVDREMIDVHCPDIWAFSWFPQTRLNQ